MSSACFLFTLLPFYFFTFLPFYLFTFNIPKQTISTKKLKIAKNNLYFSTN